MARKEYREAIKKGPSHRRGTVPVVNNGRKASSDTWWPPSRPGRVHKPRHVDVFLDSIGWSGCNTTLEAIAYDLPIVTLPTDLMRGRHSAAFLTRMHMDNYISKSIEEYINFAADLAHNKFLYNTVRGMIKENKTFLYRDCAAIHARFQSVGATDRQRSGVTGNPQRRKIRSGAGDGPAGTGRLDLFTIVKRRV